jgi:hypothetical protein
MTPPHHVAVPARKIAATLTAAVISLTAGPGLSPVPAAASPADGTVTTARTDQVHVRPVDAAGHLRTGYHVTHHHGRAHCLLGGIAVRTAYRCFAGNDRIYDPCWLQAGGTHHVLCLRDPWRHDVVRLHVTRGFVGGYGEVLPKHPWGIRLADGTRCIGSQGAAGAVDGLGISYLCLDGRTVLLENPDTSDPLWRIRVARDPAGGYDYQLVGFEAIDTTYVGRRSLRP